MFLLFFILWVIFNGRLTAEIAIMGGFISFFMYWFVCRYMDYKPKSEIRLIKNFFLVIKYIVTLIYEIIKANFQVMNFILSSRYQIEPELIRFKTDLKSEGSRVVLANSITLTPGTITVSLEEDEYLVYCLDKEFGEGINSSVFVNQLKRMEER